MSVLFLSLVSMLAVIGALFLKSPRNQFLLSLGASTVSSLLFFVHSFAGEQVALNWVVPFHLIIHAKVIGFDLVGQFFMCLLFPYIHFFLLQEGKSNLVFLFTLSAAQLLYQISVSSGNAFINFQSLMTAQLLLFLFLQTRLTFTKDALNPWLKRTFFGLLLVFFSLVLIYFFRDIGPDGRSYLLEPWKNPKQISIYDSAIRIQDVSFFLLYVGTVFILGLLDYCGDHTKVASGVRGKAGALISVLLYVFPTLFFIRLALGIFPDALFRFREELIWINFFLFLASSLRVGKQKDMKGKLVHFPGVFCSLIFLVIPSLDAGVILGSIFLLFSVLYLLVVTLVSIDCQSETSQSNNAQKTLYVLCMLSALFFPVSIAFYGLVDVFLGVREQSVFLTPVVGIIFFFSWFSLVHFFSQRSRFFRLSNREAFVSILFLVPPVVFGALPKDVLGPVVLLCENYLKGIQ